MDFDAIEEEAKNRRRIGNYEYRFDWPELASVDADLASSIRQLLEEAAPLMSTAARRSDEQADYAEIKLIRDFLFRGTKALRSTLCLEVLENYQDAWATARVIVEHCVYLKYLLKTNSAKEFFEYTALQMKKWGYIAASNNLLSKESVSAYDKDMEEALGHPLGRPRPEWSNPNFVKMCEESFGKVYGPRIYRLYQLASAQVHPGVVGGDRYLQEAVKALGVPPPRWIALQAAIGAFEELMSISRPSLMEDSS